MKIQQVKGDIERRMVIGAITNDRFLRHIQHIYNPQVLGRRSRYIAVIMKWCIDYYKRYEKAPGKEIEDIFNTKVHHNKIDDEQADLISDILTSASEEYEDDSNLNVDYLLDQTRDYLAGLQAESLAEEIKDGLVRGDVREVEHIISTYKQVELTRGRFTNPFTDGESIFDAFGSSTQPIIRLRGALGDMMNDQMTRDSLIGITAPEKRGKTWMLLEFAFAAVRSRRNVAFFEVGDMSKNQMIKRTHIRLAGRSTIKRYCEETDIPVLDCKRNQDDRCQLSYRTGMMGLGFDPMEEGFESERTPYGYVPCSTCQRFRGGRNNYEGSYWFRHAVAVQPLTWREGLLLGKKFFRRMQGRDFRLECFPNNSINVAQLENILDVWEAGDGFIPDVIVIDYADILAPEPNAPREYRHQQNETWKALRRLSQERHCLVLTATQADAKSYEQVSMTEKNFSEDKRKYGHVTGMIGLNQTKEEKERGLMRINWLVLREGEFHVRREVKVLMCLKRGMVHIDSFW